MRRAPLLALAALALVGATPAGTGGYAIRLRVAPAPGGGAQRLALPAAVLAALRNADGSDLRVFDARGRALPIARIAAAIPTRRDPLTVAPLLGAADLAADARISVRLDEQGRPRLAEVGRVAGSGGDDATTIGALLDTRRIAGAAEALDIDATLPAGQPIVLTVAASPNLSDWRTLGGRTVYRAPNAPETPQRIALDGAMLARDYLRITWSPSARLLSPVAIRRAVLLSRADGGAVSVAAAPPAFADPHAFEFVVPFATPIAALRVDPGAGALRIPVRVLGRDAPERAWTLLGEGIAGPDPIPLGGAAARTLRIEADRRTAGFDGPPALRFDFAPRQVAFAASAAPPFTLAAGLAGAEDVFLPLAAVAGQSGADLPIAAVAPGPAAPIRLSAPDTAAASRRSALLWAILLGATALLGGIAWRLWRSDRADAAPPGGDPG